MKYCMYVIMNVHMCGVGVCMYVLSVFFITSYFFFETGFLTKPKACEFSSTDWSMNSGDLSVSLLYSCTPDLGILDIYHHKL